MVVEVKTSIPSTRASMVNAETANAGVRPVAPVGEVRPRHRPSSRGARRAERADVRVAECSRRDRDEWAWLVAVAVFTVLMGVLLGLFGGSGDVRLETVGEVQVSYGRAGTLWGADR